jgi:hypothetical protein
VIGAKALGVLLLFAVGLAAALAFGVLSPDRLAMHDFGAFLLVGAFGAIVGTVAFRFFRLGERSRHYFRWATDDAAWDASEGHFLGGEGRRIALGQNDAGEAFELPPAAQRAACIILASLAALAYLDTRGVERLAHAPGSAASMASQLCPKEEEKKPPPARDPNEPGCELVRRAYALGYAKSLGACAPKRGEVDAAKPRAVCTRRQHDEPVLHYSWRLLSSFFGGLRGPSYVEKTKRDFQARTQHLGSLGAVERQVLVSAPHASHHVFTNLPDPDDGAFRETSCNSRYLRLAHRPTGSASKVFEHVVAQLLFEPTYDATAGHCREYHVHFGAPEDACERLAKNPDAFLDAAGASADVRSVIERHRLATELGPKPQLDPAGYVSFSCYVERAGDKTLARTSTPFSFAGQRFTAEVVRLPPSSDKVPLYVDRYHAVAQMFVKGFHYGALLSEAGMDHASGAAAGLEASLSGDDQLLTRLYELESIDIYLEPGWMAARPDLLDVYPYERHLKNFVQIFRKQYRRDKGRL